MKYYFIINPVAGKENVTADRIPEIQSAAKACGIPEEDVTIWLTEYPGHAVQQAQRAAQSGEAVYLYAVGGDGTLNEVIQGAMDFPNAAVGLLPYGSGNDFLRNFGIKEEFRDVQAQLRGSPISIDLIKTSRGYAAEICSAGLDAKVAYGIPKFRRLPFCHSEMAYKLSIVQCLMGKRNANLLIDIDGKTIQRDCLMVAVCNGCSYGGGFLAAPESRLDDGVLDVMVVRNLPLLRIAKALPLYQSGRHFKDGTIVSALQDVIEYFPARQVSIRTCDPADSVVINVDGECEKSDFLSAEIVPLAARIVLPDNVFDRYQLTINS